MKTKYMYGQSEWLKQTNNIKNKIFLIFIATSLMNHVEMKGEKVFLGECFVFTMNSREYTLQVYSRNAKEQGGIWW